MNLLFYYPRNGLKRRINNYEKIHTTSEQVGASLSKLHAVEKAVLMAEPADELIIHEKSVENA